MFEWAAFRQQDRRLSMMVTEAALFWSVTFVMQRAADLAVRPEALVH